MKIHRYEPGKKINIGECVTALGFFDGVHAGHRKLIEEAKKTAEEKNLSLAVFSFTSESFGIKGDCLYTTEERLSIFRSVGIDNLIFCDFESVREVSAENFVKNILFEDLRCRIAVVGKDFRFGKCAKGNAELLRSLMNERGGAVVCVPFETYNGEKISTGKIKEYLSEGRLSEARLLLGCAYFEDGVIEHGLGLGRNLGFPTLNYKKEKKTHLKAGVYRCRTEIDGKLYPSVTNVGVCPTFEERAMHAETFVIGWSGDIYGKKVRNFYLDYLRAEKKFSSEKELIMQINVDINKAITENGELTWQEIGPSLQCQET